MIKEAGVVFPHQLFENYSEIIQVEKIFLVEDSLFFKDKKYPFQFHKQKLIFHRASMQAYKDMLAVAGNDVEYIDHIAIEDQDEGNGSMLNLFECLKKSKIQTIHIMDPSDWAIEKRLAKLAKKFGIEIINHDSPGFLCNREYINEYFKEKTKYLQTPFYISQRKRFKILVSQDKPKGGKWTFDAQNRKKIPKGLMIPNLPDLKPSNHIKEAINYVENRFSKNYGESNEFNYPVTHESAKKWFQNFLEQRLKNFGPYEDAIMQNNHSLFHSLISPLLNVGLLEPQKVVEEALIFSENNEIPINSIEGFIRQIIGWREFMRAIYLREGVKQRNSNFWQHRNPLPKSFYNGTTSILPVDTAIKDLLKNAYLNHIERLMILGNFMNLCEINPNDIYTWFMELFIDAYDWVMVPNVYGMSLNADGGLITTKPYISSSNYVLKMSDFKKNDWCEVWDGLFWRFIEKHKEVLKKNPRMSMMTKLLDKMDNQKIEKHLKTANNFLKVLHKK